MYEQIELSEQGKVSSLMRDNLTKNNKQMNRCGKVVVELKMFPAKKRETEEWPLVGCKSRHYSV